MNPLITTFAVDMLSKPASLTEEDLVDQIATLRRIGSVLEKREKLLSEAFRARNKDFEWVQPDQPEPVTITGKAYICHPIKVIQKRLNTEAIKEEMGENWVEEHTKEISFVQLKFEPAGGKSNES